MFLRITRLAATAALALCAGTPIASAHVSLEVGEAKLGSSYKAVLRVPHGCAGSATLKLRVRVPEGMIGVKPMPKPGWTLDTVVGPYGRAYDNYGTPLAEGVKEIVWTGKLLDAHYDEFVFRGRIAGELTDKVLYVPVVQECETGVERWIEIPPAGKSVDDLKSPAPTLKLVPASGQAH